MKTQKELPKEFTFICDKNSKEQLKKLGVDLYGYGINCTGFNYLVYNNKVEDCSKYKFNNQPIISLSDYIEQEQPIITTSDNGEFRYGENLPSTKFEIKTNGNRVFIGGKEQKWQRLFNYMSEEHGVTLLESNMQEIERIIVNAQRKAELQAQINKLQEELNSLEK